MGAKKRGEVCQGVARVMLSTQSTQRSSHRDDIPFSPFEAPLPEAPFSAGPPPLFDEGGFSEWVKEVFTEEHEGEILGKLSAVPADDDMSRMRLLLNEEAALRRSRVGESLIKSYETPEQGAGSRDTMVIAFAGENDKLVRATRQQIVQPTLITDGVCVVRACLAGRPPRIGRHEAREFSEDG